MARHCNNLRLYISVRLTSNIISQGVQQTRLWSKRKIQCKLFLFKHYPLRHPILIFCWDICSYQQQRIPLEWLHSSSVKTQKIMMSHCSPAQRRYHRDQCYFSCSVCEKKSGGLDRRHGFNIFTWEITSLPVSNCQLWIRGCARAHWVWKNGLASRVLSVGGIWLGN